jgi:2-keto-3-deoxy-L-rhamnonate aldolase RhmA
MRQSSISSALAGSGQALGTWVQMNSPETCEIAALAGFDFVVIDMEHGSFGIAEASAMIRAAGCRGADAIVRVLTGDSHHIRQVLDAGPAGIIVPGIRTAEQARAAVSAARYEPLGTRGACPCVRSVGYGTVPWHEVHGGSDAAQVWLLVETPEAVDDIAAIVATGADAVVLGPFDLSMAMGLQGDFEHPEVVSALERVTATARAAGLEVVYVGLGQTAEANASGVEEWRRRGSRIATTLLDRSALALAYRSTLSLLREARAVPTAT